MQADRHSQTITFLKVALPLLALAILSTLFLVSRAVTPTASIPFADGEVQERLANQQVTGPYFSGTSSNGDQIAFIAERLSTPDGTLGSNKAENVLVQLDMAGGTQIMLEADLAFVDIASDSSELSGGVEIITSTGFELQSELLKIGLSELDVTSPGAVTGQTPGGNIQAGSMRLFVPEGATDAQLIFTNGVKVLYQPKPLKD